MLKFQIIYEKGFGFRNKTSKILKPCPHIESIRLIYRSLANSHLLTHPLNVAHVWAFFVYCSFILWQFSNDIYTNPTLNIVLYMSRIPVIHRRAAIHRSAPIFRRAPIHRSSAIFRSAVLHKSTSIFRNASVHRSAAINFLYVS
jgi:hypothetical protein